MHFYDFDIAKFDYNVAFCCLLLFVLNADINLIMYEQ